MRIRSDFCSNNCGIRLDKPLCMCGIFGYIGPRTNAPQTVFNGLKKLEYRGYDSWGIAFQQPGSTLGVYKDVGRMPESMPDKIELATLSNVAIGHTRWATHGGVTRDNCHPHTDNPKAVDSIPQTDNNQRIAVVHNGIIENYEEIRARLEAEQGDQNHVHKFVSRTDTEVLPHLISHYINTGLEFKAAVLKVLKDIKGRYAIVVIRHEDNSIIGAKRGSPLVVGVGQSEYFISSDADAFIDYTRDVNYLDDNEAVVISREGLEYINILNDEKISKEIIKISAEREEAKKGEFDHFMLKEIMEQGDTLFRAVEQEPDIFNKAVDFIKNAREIYFVGCGTAGKVGIAASYIFSEIAQRHVNAIVGSEFKSFEKFLTKETLLIAISQSGETADTLEAIEVARKNSVKVISIINVPGSTMERQSDCTLLTKTGQEKAVASTKATTAQLAVVTLLAYALVNRLVEGKKEIRDAASKISDFISDKNQISNIQQIAKKLFEYESLYVLGRGVNYPMALEAAIKIQEVCYIHAEGFAGGELKHGPLALIKQDTPVIVLAADDEYENDMRNNTMEVKARGGYVIGVSANNRSEYDDTIQVPHVVGPISAIVNIIPIQLMAYYMAVAKGHDPDFPRNLAKSVTVK